MLSRLSLLLIVLALSSVVSNCGPAAVVTLAHPDTGARAACSTPASSEEATALMKQLPPPMVSTASMALAAQLNTGRIGVVEYCAQRYELANYVRTSAALVPSKGATYVNRTYQWSVAYPDFWQVNDNDLASVKLRRGLGTVGIHTVSNASRHSLEEVAEAGLRRWEQQIGTKVEVIARRRLTLSNDLPAIEVVHHIGKAVVGKSRKVITVLKDRAVFIDAETYAEVWATFEPDFNHIIESFKIQE